MVRTCCAFLLIFLWASVVNADDVYKMRYNPQTGRGDWVVDLNGSGVCLEDGTNCQDVGTLRNDESTIEGLGVYSIPIALEYRADYTGANPVYEGWALWRIGGNSQSGVLWRISKNTFVGANRTYTQYAGTGIFDKAWSLRTSYFATDRVGEYYLLTDTTHFLLTGEGTKLRTY